MKEGKEAELNRLSRYFMRVYDRFHAEDSDELDGDKSRKDRADLMALREVYQAVEGMPIWPFNIKIVTRFTSLVLVPTGVLIYNLVTQSEHIDSFGAWVKTILESVFR